MAEEILELETRREKYDLLVKFPGLHMREIHRRLNMPIALVEYHLRMLEKSEVIMSIEEGGYKRYYPEPAWDEEDWRIKLGYQERKILAVLRQKIPLQITLFLLKEKRALHNEISDYLNISPSKLSFHLKKLTNLGVVRHARRGEEKGYSIADEKKIMKLLVTCKPPRDMIDGFIELWENIY